MSKKNLYIIGAGSVGGHIANNLELYNLTNKIYFIDDNKFKKQELFCGFPIIGSIDFLLNLNNVSDVIVGISSPSIKLKIYNKLKKNKNLIFPSIVATNTWISNSVLIGEGCIIYPNVSINYDSVIGNFVTINMNCALGHHAVIEDFSSLAPGVNFGGHTQIGKCVDIGIGASTKQGITIGDNSVIGGQAMVTNSFPDNSIIVGVPAKIFVKNEH